MSPKPVSESFPGVGSGAQTTSAAWLPGVTVYHAPVLQNMLSIGVQINEVPTITGEIGKQAT